ncbi:MAG: LysR family transcriptional regulator [Rhodospirillaceae bacterium]|nr:LysR family transcriptional regulator [Rhodospirillaceae bacterium]
MQHLPSLRAVRAFEACYRLGSFTRAARELHVGQPAISHQIRLLEADLGQALFEKRGPLTRPTAIADEYYRSVALALSGLDAASRRIRQRGAGELLTIATYPGIATFWALPRLSARSRDGHEKAARAAWRVVTAERDADIDLEAVDAAILFGEGNWPGYEHRLLLPECVVPVAAPGLARELAGLSPAQLLRSGPLIHLDDPERRWFTWQDWQARFAPEAAEVDRSLVVTNHGIAIYQALQGLGVALGWQGVIDDLLRAGLLVALGAQPLVSSRGYHLVARPGWFETAPGAALLGTLAPSAAPG